MLAHRRQARPKNLLTLDKERQVEQALAFGRSDAWIIRELRVTQAQVDDVRLWLDEVNASPDSGVCTRSPKDAADSVSVVA